MKEDSRTLARRGPGESRQAILDAARQRLAESGPEAIRLTDIAKDVGLSHPTILHHFGSRAGLLQAVEQDGRDHLLAKIEEVLAKPASETTLESLVLSVFRILGDSGQARLWAWRGLALGARAEDAEQVMLRQLTDAVHARRAEYARIHKLDVPTREDSSFVIRLLNSALLGEAVAGALFDLRAELDGQQGAQQRFRSWLARLLKLHIESGAASGSES